MPTYTVKQVKPTGKSDPTYGEEYFVQFEEDDRAVKMSRKQEPTVGLPMDGTIEQNKYGAYFKKAPFVPRSGNFGGGVASAPAFTPAAAAAKPAYNPDGARIGMVINNAANYVTDTSVATGVTLTADAWADEVFSYAEALFAKGELGQPSAKKLDTVVEPTDEPINLDDVNAIFG